MNGRPLDEIESQERVLPRPSSFLQCIEYLSDSTGVFDFLGKDDVLAAFVNSRDRVSAFLNGPERFSEIGDSPPGTSWVGLWNAWLEEWITKRQSDIDDWRAELVDTCATLSTDPCWQAPGAWALSFPTSNFQFPDGWKP